MTQSGPYRRTGRPRLGHERRRRTPAIDVHRATRRSSVGCPQPDAVLRICFRHPDVQPVRAARRVVDHGKSERECRFAYDNTPRDDIPIQESPFVFDASSLVQRQDHCPGIRRAQGGSAETDTVETSSAYPHDLAYAMAFGEIVNQEAIRLQPRSWQSNNSPRDKVGFRGEHQHAENQDGRPRPTFPMMPCVVGHCTDRKRIKIRGGSLSEIGRERHPGPADCIDREHERCHDCADKRP